MIINAILFLVKESESQAEAAQELGISLSYFQKILRLKRIPNFRSDRGKALAERFEVWSDGMDVMDIFPEAYFNRQFLERPKTHIRTMPFRLLMKGGDFKLSLPAMSQPSSHKVVSPRKKWKK